MFFPGAAGQSMRNDVSAKPRSTRDLDGSNRSERRYPLFRHTKSEELCPEMNSSPALQFKWTPPNLSTCHRVDGRNGRATHSVGSTESARLPWLNRHGVAHRVPRGEQERGLRYLAPYCDVRSVSATRHRLPRRVSQPGHSPQTTTRLGHAHARPGRVVHSIHRPGLRHSDIRYLAP